MRRAALVALFATLVAATARGQDDPRVELTLAAPTTAWVQQPIDVDLTIAWHAAWFDEAGVSLFRQPVDVPVHVSLPWLQASPDRAVELAPPPPGAPTARLAVGDRVVAAELLPPAGREGWVRARLRCRWLPLAAGEPVVAPVRVRYAFATEFRQHVLRGREPVDRQERTVATEPRTLSVRALPKPAPEGFTGAVGEFEVAATSGGERVRVGDTFRVELTVTGAGNLARFAPPKVPTLDGFHVDGVVEQDAPAGRRFVLDVLALREGVTEVPQIPFVAFSPTKGDYVTLRAEPVPVLVDPVGDDADLPARVRELVDEDRRRRGGDGAWLWRFGFLALAIVGIWMFRRGQQGRGRRALRDALHELRVSVAGVGGAAPDLERAAAAFEKLLALASGGETYAGKVTWDGLRDRGVAPEGLERLQELQAALDGARFGGPMPDAGDVLAAAETLVGAAGA